MSKIPRSSPTKVYHIILFDNKLATTINDFMHIYTIVIGEEEEKSPRGSTLKIRYDTERCTQQYFKTLLFNSANGFPEKFVEKYDTQQELDAGRQ